MLLLIFLLHRRMEGLEVGTLGKSLVRTAIAAGLMAVVVWGGVRWVQGMTGLDETVGVWLAALGGMALAVVSYGAFTLLLGSGEARWLVGLVLRRGRTK
jgi:peptidoglycan biosynthesis protein MviN/MurJ (putative lipid II flippase)